MNSHALKHLQRAMQLLNESKYSFGDDDSPPPPKNRLKIVDDDPDDSDHINCIDCHAPYSHNWTNKDKEKLAYVSGKNHYTCTFDRKFKYKNTQQDIEPLD